MLSLRHAWRRLAGRPAFSAVAIGTLALAIGANAAIFSVIDAVFLRPLPFPQPDRIVIPWESEIHQRLGFDRLPSSPADFTDFLTRNTTFESFASIRADRVNLTGIGEPERLGAVRVSGQFFAVIGVPPLVGRTFVPEDAEGGRVMLIAERLWRRRFAADPNIAGRTVSLNGEPATIVGVLPSWFRFPAPGELPQGFGFSLEPVIWSLDVLSTASQHNRGGKSFVLIGRLEPGVSAAAAQADLTGIANAIARESPGSNTAGWTVRVMSLREQLVGGVRPALMVLLIAAWFVLLIACTNVANLLLVRAAARQREMCIRHALGAARTRLMIQLLAESVLLASVAGAFGLLIGWSVLRALMAALPATLPALADAGFDRRGMLFTLALSLAIGVACGLVPAAQATQCDTPEGLREGGRGTVGSRRVHRISMALVAGEVALAVLLLIGTMLLLQTFVRLTRVPTGFRSAGVLTVEMALPPSAYAGQSATSFFETLLGRVSAMPGVDAAGVTSGLPLSGTENLSLVTVAGHPRPDPGQEVISEYRIVTPGYFRVLGIPIIDGELLPEQSSAGGPRLAVINETMARTCWPAERAMGRRFKLATFDQERPWYTVAGIVGDTKYSALDSPVRPQVYVHQRQDPSQQMTLVVLSARDPALLAAPVRAAVLAIDPNQPVGRVRTMEEVVAASVSSRRFYLLLVGLFAALALMLSLVGLYAVVSYSVAQRLREMAVRLALGAQPSHLLALVLSEGLTLVGAGIAIGLFAALGLTRFLEALLFGVHARDPLTFVVVPVLIFVAALLGCVGPARRAMRVDPATALRSE